MKKRELRESLESLRGELGRIDSVDETSRDLLEHLLRDISEILERSEEEPSEKHAGLLERLEQSTQNLEAAHPDLSAVLQRAINALADMGI